MGSRCFSIAPKKSLTCEISALYLGLLQYVLFGVQNAGWRMLLDLAMNTFELADRSHTPLGMWKTRANWGEEMDAKPLWKEINPFGEAPPLNTLVT